MRDSLLDSIEDNIIENDIEKGDNSEENIDNNLEKNKDNIENKENIIDNNENYNENNNEDIIENNENNNNENGIINIENNISNNIGDNNSIQNNLINMGFEASLVNTICNNVHPVDIEEALDYLNKNEQGLFTHSYMENERFVCLICGKGRGAHVNEAYFLEQIINDNNNNDNSYINNIIIEEDSISEDSHNNTNNNLNSTLRRNQLEYSYNRFKLKTNINKNKKCGICEEEINEDDINIITIQCNHIFCKDCWLNYLEEKISNANVAKILCMQSGCGVVLNSNFIKNILESNSELINKYNKFLQRQKVFLSNKKYKFCPFPDCEGYAEKKDKNKVVKCNFGHTFCFDCLNKPHGKRNCSEIIDKEFEKWKSHKILKRCPNCRMWTEKNEGCNHMTCVECKFQWCWLCQKQYNYNHYTQGSCRGLQFLKEDDETKIKKLMEENLKNPINNNVNNNVNNNLILNHNRNYNRGRNRNNITDCCHDVPLFKCCFTFYCYFIYYILKQAFYLLRFIFLFPYVFMLYNYYRFNLEGFLIYFLLSLFLPFFICFSIFSISLFSVICIPSIYNTRYRHFVKTFYTDFLDEIPFTILIIENEHRNFNNLYREV